VQTTVEVWETLIVPSITRASGASKPLHEQSIDDFDELMAVNVRGLFLCMKYEIQQMLTQGVIVNTSAIAVDCVSDISVCRGKHAVMGTDTSGSAGLCQAGHSD